MARRDQPAPHRAEGEARDLPLHGRRAVAPGNVRLQARAGQVRRPADARVVHQGPADRAAPGAAVEVPRRRSIRSRSSASRGRRSARSCRTSARSPTRSASSARCETEAINHDPAHTFMNTGTTISGRPSMGSWVTYGLGSESDDLPGFVVLTSPGEAGRTSRSRRGSGTAASCPAGSRASICAGKGDPVLYLSQPAGRRRASSQRDVIDAVNALNGLHPVGRRRPRDRHAHQPVRDGLPHAGQRARA